MYVLDEEISNLRLLIFTYPMYIFIKTKIIPTLLTSCCMFLSVLIYGFLGIGMAFLPSFINASIIQVGLQLWSRFSQVLYI